MRNLKILLISAVLFVSAILNSRLYGQNDFPVSVDYASYYQNDTSAVLELYLSFYHKYFKYVKKGDLFEASAIISVKISGRDNGLVFEESTFQFPISVKDTNIKELISSEITQLNFLLGSGRNYIMKIISSDANQSAHKDSVSTEIAVPQYTLGKPSFSDIEFVSSYEKLPDSKSRFAKYGFEVIPSVINVFGNNINNLTYYAEIYGLKSLSNQESYRLKRVVKNAADSSVFTVTKILSTENDIYPDMWKLKIDSFETGQYYLLLSLINEKDEELANKSKKFYIYNSQKNITGINTDIDEQLYLKSEYSAMNEEQLQKEFDYTVYIRNSVETKEYNGLTTIESRRRYMFTFWKKRDMTPNTPVNEVKSLYMQRIKYANDNFKEPFKEGWKTDRGRILVLYGSPNDIERHEFESDIRSYQIWRFEQIEGGSIAVFGELQYDGSGIYELIHSTIRGEYSDPNWQTRLKK